jgi:GNAT superfamily N-acetyltransferase
MYAVLGAKWVKSGCFSHFVVVPTADLSLLQAWYALSFGIEQVHALRSLADYQTDDDQTMPPDVEIRRAGPADRDILANFSDVIWKHQVQAPVWGVHLPENADEQRHSWADLADDETATIWLAFYRGAPAGVQVYFAAEASAETLLIPENCVQLAVAGTRESARGKGIGQALTRHGLAHARTSGSAYCEADWRSTNLLASRFWPHQGFYPVAYRLARRIDPRIAWGRGDSF